jgi:hypothetical protein
MHPGDTDHTVERLLRQQAALATFGSFAFKETNLLAILTEAAHLRSLPGSPVLQGLPLPPVGKRSPHRGRVRLGGRCRRQGGFAS